VSDSELSSLEVLNLSKRLYEEIEKREKKSAGMEALDRIERKLRKLREWCETLFGESIQNHEQYLFQEVYDIVVNQIVFNLADIDELRIDYAHGVDISPQLKKLKWEFNFVTRFYRDLCSLYRDPYRPRRAERRPQRPRQ